MTKPRGKPRCTICLSARCVEIEVACAAGVSHTAVAKKYEVSEHAVRRHWRHVDDVRKANLTLGPVQKHMLAARVAEEAGSVVDNLRVVRAGLWQSFHAAIKNGDNNSVGNLSGRLHENLRILARITGEIAASPLISNVTNNNTLVADANFLGFMTELADALAPWPDARRAVLERFAALERGASDAIDVPMPALPAPALEHVQAVIDDDTERRRDGLDDYETAKRKSANVEVSE